MQYQILILGRDIVWGCRCAALLCDIDLTFDISVVTLTFKSFLGYILKTVMYRKLMHGREIGWGV